MIHTLQYLEILNDIIDHETALYKIKILSFFAPEIISKININHHGVISIITTEKLPGNILKDFQDKFELNLKDTRQINKYGNNEIHVSYKYVFRKTDYDQDNKSFWMDKTFSNVSEQIKNTLTNLY